MTTQFTSFGIELNQHQIDFLKKRYNLTSNQQVRMYLENKNRQQINKEIENYAKQPHK